MCSMICYRYVAEIRGDGIRFVPQILTSHASDCAAVYGGRLAPLNEVSLHPVYLTQNLHGNHANKLHCARK